MSAETLQSSSNYQVPAEVMSSFSGFEIATDLLSSVRVNEVKSGRSSHHSVDVSGRKTATGATDQVLSKKSLF